LAGSHIDAGIVHCSERGLELFRLYLLASRSRLELNEGRWSDAAETAAAVLRIPRTSTTPRIVALVVLGLVRARRGDPDVWPLLDEARALAEPTGELPRVAPVAAARAEAAWLEGRPEAVAGETEAAFRLALLRGSPWPAGELALWRRRAGLEDRIDMDVADPCALELAGRAENAAAAWAELGCPYDAALTLAQAGGQRQLRRALDELQRLEARPAAAVVTRRLRELGARDLPRGPRKATRDNPAGLTPREVEVLSCITAGLSNAEMAVRLFVSEKTVEHHVSAILRKLGVPTRGRAAAQALQLGLV
jgi:DNA-binding CsgD family transcriptional regulator